MKGKNTSSKGKNVFVFTNACERRKTDTNKISTYLIKNNYKIVNDPKDADYIIFITCSFVNRMVDRCVETIKEFNNYDAELIVAGCMPDIAGDKLKEIFNGKTISTKDLENIDEILKDTETKFRDIEDVHSMWRNYNPLGISAEPINTFKRIMKKVRIIEKIYIVIRENVLKKIFGNVFPFNVLYSDDGKKYIITVSRGCIHKCSYCAIRKAVGPLKSKPVEQCVKEFKEGLRQGYKEFELAADDIGPYGIDIKKSLTELLDELTKIEGDYSIRFQNTHPAWIIRYIDDLEKIFKRKKIKYILFSIQSGNNRILKLMRRAYTKESLIDVVSKLRKFDSDLNIGAELMVGFPSETTEEFMETLDLFNKISFEKGTMASCSLIEGTEAINLEPKISKQEMSERMKIALKFLKNSGYYAWYSNLWKGIAFNKK